MAGPGELLIFEERPTAQLIANHLREQIIQGVFRPGQQINESVLAGQLRTSRGPLREALQRLAQEGLLVSYRNRGVFVQEMSLDDIKEIYAVREAVESAAAKILLAAPQEQINLTGNALKESLTEMAKQVELSDWHAMSRLDMQFHTSFVEGAKNSRLLRIYDTLAAETRMCISISKLPTREWMFWCRSTRASWTCWKPAIMKDFSVPSVVTCMGCRGSDHSTEP